MTWVMRPDPAIPGLLRESATTPRPGPTRKTPVEYVACRHDATSPRHGAGESRARARDPVEVTPPTVWRPCSRVSSIDAHRVATVPTTNRAWRDPTRWNGQAAVAGAVTAAQLRHADRGRGRDDTDEGDTAKVTPTDTASCHRIFGQPSPRSATKDLSHQLRTPQHPMTHETEQPTDAPTEPHTPYPVGSSPPSAAPHPAQHRISATGMSRTFSVDARPVEGALGVAARSCGWTRFKGFAR
ncbi:hypothetical protein EHYA_08800 [Embleya hyalina]|uniref:Uncharacterized protein n=1 Tax=Embleya hyalina TaxID=516124 RepID=A0A401Z2L7_9ACTN|nr:hypothetical protein EHYA_08800 [Embleya hyalina]